MLTNALTIDVEDWFHPELVRSHVDPRLSEGRAFKALPPILNLLDRYRVKATFFVLGEVAQRFPELVRQIYDGGHELGSHGMSHQMLRDLGEKGFRKEVEDFGSLMRDILGTVEIKGFRAPTLSLNMETKWALPILRDFGYLYDASIFPASLFWNRLYGVEGAPRFPYRVSFDNPGREDPTSPLWEFPTGVTSFLGFCIPVSGGFYLRTFPLWFFKWALRRLNKEGPFSIYLHPWECDVNTPRVPLPLSSRGVTYYGIRGMLSKLEALLETFSFSRMDEVLKRWSE